MQVEEHEIGPLGEDLFDSEPALTHGAKTDPRALGQELHAADPLSPGYLGRLTRLVRTRPSDVEGLYVSPIPPDAALHIPNDSAISRNHFSIEATPKGYVASDLGSAASTSTSG